MALPEADPDRFPGSNHARDKSGPQEPRKAASGTHLTPGGTAWKA